MWCMARLSDVERREQAGQISQALDSALGLHGWTWSMAAAEMKMDRPQLNRMRTGAETFDLVRLLKLPGPIYEDFQAFLVTRRGGGARLFAAVMAVLAEGALASRGLVHAAWAAVVESRREVTVA
jgi:hypothetical protein